MSRKNTKPNRGRSVRNFFENDGSVSLGKIDGVDIRLTTQNTVFIVYGENLAAWPYLRGETVQFDVIDHAREFTPRVIAKLKGILKKKEEIRKQHALDFDEDEMVYTYN